MEDKVNGERKKLSLSSGGKLTLKNSITTNKSSNSIATNSRISRGTVQVEVKRTKRPSNRPNLTENISPENSSGLSVQEIQSRSKKLQEGLAKTAAEAEIIASEKIEKAKLEEARIAANALEAVEAASTLAPKDKMLARRKAETEEILEIKKIEEEQAKIQIDAKLAEEEMYQIKMLIDNRFGHGTFQGILETRQKRIKEYKEAQIKLAKQKAAQRAELMNDLKLFVWILLGSLVVVIGVVAVFLVDW